MMRRLPAILAGMLLCALPFLMPAASAKNGDVAGSVARIKGTALAVQDAVPRVLKVGDSVLIGDVLSTGKESRLEIRMADDGTFTLGERASFVVIDFQFGQDEGNAAFRLMSGAMRAVSGKIAQANPDKFKVETEFGALGVRGTDFWGGTMEDGAFHVALLGGKAVIVTTRGGRVEITQRDYGTAVTGPDAAPTPPRLWSDDRLRRAAASVAF